MTCKVLLVDDSIVVGKQLGQVVEEIDGFEVLGHAQNGAEAIKLFKTLEPDLVLMDIVMPMMDGIQSLRTLMALNPDTKVVIISSVGGDAKKVEEALRLGARNVISKPFDKEKVQTILKHVFEEE